MFLMSLTQWMILERSFQRRKAELMKNFTELLRTSIGLLKRYLNTTKNTGRVRFQMNGAWQKQKVNMPSFIRALCLARRLKLNDKFRRKLQKSRGCSP